VVVVSVVVLLQPIDFSYLNQGTADGCCSRYELVQRFQKLFFVKKGLILLFLMIFEKIKRKFKKEKH
jgi:hypothetical protein